MANYNNTSPNISNGLTADNGTLPGIELTGGGAYVVLSPGDTVVSNDSVTAPMWSNNDPTLTVFYTSSTQVSSNVQEYYTSIYQTASTEVSAEIQFDIAYGDLVGSGSQFLNNLVTGSSPTRTNYGQYRNLVLGNEDASFIFSSVTSSYWYAMPIERARYKQSILPGTWTLALQGFSSEIVQTAIVTDLVQDPLTQLLIAGSYGTVANGKISFLESDGSVVTTNAAGNPNEPAFAGTIAIVIQATTLIVTSLTLSSAATNIKAGMLLKILGTGIGGLDGTNDLYLRVSENWMNGTSIITLTDDSKLSTTTQFCDAGRIFQIISGSAGVLTTNTSVNINGYTAASGSYGYMLPDINTLILNGEALDAIPQRGGINFGTSRSFDSKGENARSLVNALNRGGAVTGFTINSKEDLSSDFMFCRARNSEYNYSANPSFISSSTGAVLFPEFINNPTTYITTVGLYSPAQELLAVAKLSRPLEKNFTKELLVRVKLDF